MASIRRTLSPVPRPGSLLNGEGIQVSSPLSRSSSNCQNYTPHGGTPLDYLLYNAQSFIHCLLLQRPFQSSDRSKLKGRIWRRGCFHFLMSFFIGIFVGLFVSLNLSDHFRPKQQSFDFDMFHSPMVAFPDQRVVGRTLNSTLETLNGEHSVEGNGVFDELIIVVTPTFSRPLQSYYLNRLGHTLKLIPVPLLWIVVEMNSQSVETAELLRNTGVMYRHLACNVKNFTELTNVNAVLRNVALSHIQNHTLDGIVYFADDNNTYSVKLFHQMRKISRIGTWTVARLVESEGKVSWQGPICNGTQVIGWHLDDTAETTRRFHSEMSGFAFNSTILWDPKRWHRPSMESIRQIEEVGENFEASRFMQQILEDESQMECFSPSSGGIMVWT